MRGSVIYSEIQQEILNWRRFYRTAQRFSAVSWYQPPKSGDTLDDLDIATLPLETQNTIAANKKLFQQQEITKLPINMQNAIKCETVWRNLEDQSIKYYLKWFYLVRMPDAPLWRKLKQYNVRIKNYTEADIFDRKALEYFGKRLEL